MLVHFISPADLTRLARCVMKFQKFCQFFFSSRRRHTRFSRDWSSDVCSSDLHVVYAAEDAVVAVGGLHRAVAAQERPVVPIFAARVLVVLGEVGLDVAVAISPDRLQDRKSVV